MTKNLPPPLVVKLASGRNVILFMVLFIAFAGFILPSFEDDIKAMSGGVGVLDLEYFYAPIKASTMLSAYGPEGIRLYLIAQWTVDLIFPAIAGMMFTTAFIWLGQPRFWFLGPTITLVDWIENVFVTVLLLQQPVFHPEIAWLSCFFTTGKWSCLAVCNLLVLYHGGKKLLAHRRLKARLV